MPSLVMRNVNVFITLVGVHEMYTHIMFSADTWYMLHRRYGIFEMSLD